MKSARMAMGLMLGLIAPVMAAANEVTDVRFDSAEGEVVFTLTTQDQAPQPNVFTTEQPPRIVVELPGTTTSLPGDTIPVGVGPAQSFTTLSAGSRTRMVIDLSRPAPYTHSASGNEVKLSVETGRQAASMSASSGSQRTGSGGGPAHEVTGIDFRRAEDGSGRVIVKTDRPGVSMSVNDRAGSLDVDLYNTELGSQWRQRLDVTDFATPVQIITPEAQGENVRLNVDVSGAYEHLAYQSGNDLIIEVSRPEQEQPEDEELQFFEEREYTGERITLNFQDIAVRSVLQLIADVSDLNIVVADTVSGSVTLRLTNVPWDQALDIVLETKNLDMRRSGNVIWVAPAEEIAAREQQLLRARQERQTLEPLRTAMIAISYADAVAMAELLRSTSSGDTEGSQGMLSSRGSVSVDTRTNTLLVTDTADRIEEVRALVSDLDRPVRQVLIESRIVIARNDFNHSLGVRFGLTASREDSRGNVVGTAGTVTALDRMNNLSLISRRGNTGSSLPNTGAADPPGGIAVPPLNERLNVNLPVSNPAGSFGWTILAADYLLDLELSALESEGKGEVISTPRVIAANQEEAFINQGVEIPYEQATSAGATSVQFKEAVLELKVTPLITPDNRIQLNLAVKQDTVGEIFETGRGGTVPSIDTRELGTRVLVENGQTVVLGGIFQEDRQVTNSKVPVLGDVPVMGALFRRKSTEEQKRELLIFVTPTIMDERAAFD